MIKVNNYYNILKKGAYFSIIVPGFNNIIATDLEKFKEDYLKFITKIKSDIIENYNLKKIIEKFSINNNDFDKILSELKHNIFDRFSGNKEKLKEFLNGIEITNYNIDNIEKIRNNFKTFTIDHLADESNKIKFEDIDSKNKEFGLLKLMIIKEIESNIFSTFDDYKKNTEMINDLKKICEKYKFLEDEDYTEIIKLNQYKNANNFADEIVYFLDDIIEFRNNFKDIKNNTVFTNDDNEKFKKHILQINYNPSIYFIKKIYDYLKKNNNFSEEEYNKVIKEIKIYVKPEDIDKTENVINIFLNRIAIFYNNKFNNVDFKLYNGDIINSINDLTKDIYEKIVEDLKNTNEIYKDIENYYTFLNDNKEILNNIDNIYLYNDFNSVINNVVDLNNIKSENLINFKNIKESFDKIKEGDIENIKNSLENKVKNNNIKNIFYITFNKRYDIIEQRLAIYNELEKKILKKFIDDIKEKINNLKILNNSFIEVDKKDLSIYSNEFFDKLSLNNFNSRNSIDDIERIELDIINKIKEYNERKNNLNNKFKIIVDTNKLIYSVDGTDYKLKIDEKYNKEFFDNLQYINIPIIESEINQLEIDVKKANDEYIKALTAKIEKDKKDEEKAKKIKEAEDKEKTIKNEILKLCNDYFEEIKGLIIDESFDKNTISINFDNKINKLYTDNGYDINNLTGSEDINNRLNTAIQKLKSDFINNCNKEIDKKLKEIRDKKAKDLEEQQKRDKELEEQKKKDKEKDENKNDENKDKDENNNIEITNDNIEKTETKITCCKKCNSRKNNK